MTLRPSGPRAKPRWAILGLIILTLSTGIAGAVLAAMPSPAPPHAPKRRRAKIESVYRILDIGGRLEQSDNGARGSQRKSAGPQR
jgi:hypothetical protein